MRFARCLALLGLLLVALSSPPARAQTADDQGVLAGFLSRLLSTPTSKVRIGAVEGALSSDAVIRDVSVADDAGVYLTIDRIRLVWRRTALLQRRIEVERLEIGRVALVRRPTAASGEPEPGPLLPELPLSLSVGRFTLGELALGEAVLSLPARLSATGSASLGAPSQGLRADLAIRRLDAAGSADLALSFVPEGERLDVKLALDEPPGGLLARLTAIPGEPPVRLDLTGAGTLDDWSARLAFSGGPDLDARGDARLQRAGGERLLTLDVAARLTPLLPPVVAPIFAGTTALSGSIAFADSGRIDLRGLRLGASLAELTLDGAIAADRRIDLRARARALPNADGATTAGGSRLGRLVFDGRATGPIAAPRIEGDLDLADFSTPEGSLASLRGRFTLAPASGDATGRRLALDADAAARGFRSTDAGVDEAVGRDIDLVVRGTIEDGVATFSEARLASPTLRLSFQGRLGRQVIDGRVENDIPRLAAFSRLAGRPLGGRAGVTAAIAGDLARPDFTARLSGEVTDPSVGDTRLDRLLGRRVTLAGQAQVSGRVLRLQGLRVASPTVTATLDGEAASEALAVDGALRLADLALLDDRLRGAADLRLRLTGPMDDPSAVATLSAPNARALGRPIRDLVVSLDARRFLSTPDIALAGRGGIGGEALSLDGLLRGDDQNAAGARGWSVERLTAALGSVSLQGAGRLSADGFAEGRATLAAGDLNDISPLALTRLSGRLNAELRATLGDEGGRRRQDLTIQAQGGGISGEGFALKTLSADLTAQDLYARPVLRGAAKLAGLSAGALTFDSLDLTAADGGQGASALRLAGKASGFALAAAGLLQPGPPIALRIDSLRAARAGRTLALARPATLRIADGSLRTDGVELAVAGGRIGVSGRAGRELDLALRVDALPLAAADILAPGLGLTGVAAGEAAITGPAAAPRGPFSLTLRGFGQPALRSAGAPPLDIQARGRLEGDAASIDATLRGGRAIDLAVTGRAGLAASAPIDLRIRGGLDAALANTQLGGSGQRVAGRVTVDASVAGTRAAPRLSGSATLSGGSLQDLARGLTITNIEGRVTGRGDTLAIERLSGGTADGGTLALAGQITVDPGRNFPADLRLTGRRARLVDDPLARLTADLDLAITGPLAAAPRIGGRVGILSLDLRVPERLGGARDPLRDARHIAPPPQTRARLAQAARARAGARRAGPPFRAAIDVAIDAPGRIFLRGRGIDAELGGSLRLTGTTLDPVVNGAFDLRRGRLSILTQRLDFTRGRLAFGGAGFIPELDLVAETRAGDVTARIAVSGPADAPTFDFTSSPALPQDEVLSRLLFQRASGGLSAFQAVQLAQAVAQFSGSGGPDAFESARRALGVDDLDIGTAADGSPTVGVSRAIGSRARIGVRAGTRPENSAVGIDIDLTRRLRLQTEIGGDGRAAVGVGIEQEY